MLEVDSPKWENTKIKWAKDTVRLLSLYALFYPFLGSPILRFPVPMSEGEILLCPGWRALRSPAQEAHKWIAASLDTSRHELCSLEEEESGIYWAHTFSIPGTGSGLSWTRFVQSLTISQRASLYHRAEIHRQGRGGGWHKESWERPMS